MDTKLKTKIRRQQPSPPTRFDLKSDRLTDSKGMTSATKQREEAQAFSQD